MGVGATGPLTSPIFPDPLQHPRPAGSVADLLADANAPKSCTVEQAGFPALLNQTGNYAQASLAPVGFVLPVKPETLVQQAGNNSKEQFANSPDLKDALMHAIMDALEAHSTMSTQALESERVRAGLKDILLGPAQLYEALRARSQGGSAAP